MASSLVEEALKNKKKTAAQAATIAPVLSEAAGVDVPEEALSAKNVEAVVNQEPKGSAKDKDNQRLLFTAIGAALPTLIGAAFGGAEGGAMGAQAGTQFATTMGANFQKESEAKVAAEKAEKDAKLKQAEKLDERAFQKELKGMDLDVKNQEKQFANIQGLRKEYESHPITRSTREISGAYEKLNSAVANPSAAGDLSLMFNFMKVIDPGAKVKEGEFATAENASNVPTKILAAYNNALKGERLSESQRVDFQNQASNIYQVQLNQQKILDQGFANQASKNNLDPADVMFGGMEKSQFPRQVRRGNEVATVKNENELEEAQKDGFQ